MRSEKQLSILNPRRGSLISVLFPIIPEGRRGDALGQELIIKCLFFPSVSFCFLLFPFSSLQQIEKKSVGDVRLRDPSKEQGKGKREVVRDET